MCIRACSRLISVDVGPAKQLFAKNRRLGIYQWKEILDTEDPETGDIMVLRFADTEEFRTPVPLAFAESIGIKSNFPPPVNIILRASARFLVGPLGFEPRTKGL